MTEPPERPTARVVVLADDAVLLVQTSPADQPLPSVLDWYLPGGGVHRGESYERAALRELWEETGLTVHQLADDAWLWRRERLHRSGRRFLERFFLVRSQRFAPQPAGLDAAEQTVRWQFRWWTASAIRASDQRFDPPQLPELLDALLADPERERAERPRRLPHPTARPAR